MGRRKTMNSRSLICLALLSLSYAPALAQDGVEAEGLVGEPIVRRDQRYRGVLQPVNGRLTLVGADRGSKLELGQDRLSSQLRSLTGWRVELAAHERDSGLYPTELLSPRAEVVRGWVQRSGQGLQLREGSSPGSVRPLRDPSGALGHALGQAGPRSLTLRVLRLGREAGVVEEVRVLAVEARVARPGKLFAKGSDVFRALWARGTGEVGGRVSRVWMTRVEAQDAGAGQVAAFVRHSVQVLSERRDPWDGALRMEWKDQVNSGFLDAAALAFGDEVVTVEGELQVTPSTLRGTYHTGGAAYNGGVQRDPRLKRLRASHGRRVRITAVRQGTQLRLSPLASAVFLPTPQQSPEAKRRTGQEGMISVLER
jgi:hypothetical protein